MIGQTAPQPDPAQTQAVSPTALADAQAPASDVDGADVDVTDVDVMDADVTEVDVVDADVAEEFGGREGLPPTRYGDWEKNGRCIDF